MQLGTGHLVSLLLAAFAATLQCGVEPSLQALKVTFNGNISFTNNGYNAGLDNTGESRGGAVYLAISSTLSLPHTTVCWENNHANLGGAIYVMNSNPLIYSTPIVKFIPKQVKNVSFNSLAKTLTSTLFSRTALLMLQEVCGAKDNCKLNGLNSSTSGEVFDLLVQQKSFL